MCCGTESHHGGSCGCGGHFHFGRRFPTKEERVAKLEEYLEILQKEVQGVEEHIAALKGEE